MSVTEGHSFTRVTAQSSSACLTEEGRGSGVGRARFARSKLSWITLPDSAPAFEVYYDMKALWPTAGLEQLDAIIAPANSGA